MIGLPAAFSLEGSQALLFPIHAALPTVRAAQKADAPFSGTSAFRVARHMSTGWEKLRAHDDLVLDGCVRQYMESAQQDGLFLASDHFANALRGGHRRLQRRKHRFRIGWRGGN